MHNSVQFRLALLETIQANMLKTAADIRMSACLLAELPKRANFNCPQFVMSDEFRRQLIARADAIGAAYGGPGWAARQLTLWINTADSQAA